MLLHRLFSGFSFPSGYKLATFSAVFVANWIRWLLHDTVKLFGYFHLLVGIEVAVGVHRGLYLFVAETFGNQ